MTEGSGGRRLPEAPAGAQRRVSPPPTPAQRMRQTGSFQAQIPKTESFLPREISERLQALLGVGLSKISRSADGGIVVDGKSVGIYNESEARALISYDAATTFRVIAVPSLLRTMAEGKGFVIFFEITASGTEICAGREIGQKLLISRIM